MNGREFVCETLLFRGGRIHFNHGGITCVTCESEGLHCHPPLYIHRQTHHSLWFITCVHPRCIEWAPFCPMHTPKSHPGAYELHEFFGLLHFLAEPVRQDSSSILSWHNRGEWKITFFNKDWTWARGRGKQRFDWAMAPGNPSTVFSNGRMLGKVTISGKLSFLRIFECILSVRIR